MLLVNYTKTTNSKLFIWSLNSSRKKRTFVQGSLTKGKGAYQALLISSQPMIDQQ